MAQGRRARLKQQNTIIRTKYNNCIQKIKIKNRHNQKLVAWQCTNYIYGLCYLEDQEKFHQVLFYNTYHHATGTIDFLCQKVFSAGYYCILGNYFTCQLVNEVSSASSLEMSLSRTWTASLTLVSLFHQKLIRTRKKQWALIILTDISRMSFPLSDLCLVNTGCLKSS